MASTNTASFNGTVHLALETYTVNGPRVKDTLFLDPSLPLLAKVVEAATKDNRADYKDLPREKVEQLQSALQEVAARKRDHWAKQGVRSAISTLKGFVAYKEKAGNGARIRLSAVTTGHSRRKATKA